MTEQQLDILILIRTLISLTFHRIYEGHHPFDIFFSLLNISFPAGFDQHEPGDRRRISPPAAGRQIT